MSTTSSVKKHYNRFPYPKADSVEWNTSLRHEINTLLGIHKSNPLKDNAKILIAGCGTREAIFWAKSFPQAEVFGVDLSETSIEISQNLIQQLELKNVRVEQRSLLDLNDQDGQFDFISSYGVLHHLPDPQQGLATIKQRLKPSGIMQLMFYNQRGRYFLHEFQKMVSELDLENTEQSRIQTGKLFTKSLFANGTRMQDALQMAQHQLANNEAQWADMFIHPLEHAYDLDNLFELLEHNEMQFLSWRHPYRWYVEPRLQNEELVRQYQQLPEEKQWRIADILLMPLYEFFCCKKEEVNQDLEWLQNDEQLLQTVLYSPTFQSLKIKENQITNEISEGRFLIIEEISDQNQRIKINTPGGLHLTAHKIFYNLIQNIDGQKTLGDVLQITASEAGITPDSIKKTVLEIIRKLIIPHQALVAKK